MPSLGDVKSSTAKVIDVVDVKVHGDALIIPENMDLERVDKVIHQKMQFDDTVVAVNAQVPGFVPEAAFAFFQAMSVKYGWVNQIPTPGFFGDRPPATLTIEVSKGKSIQVPWGRFQLPYVEGYLESGVSEDEQGRLVFTISGEIKRKYEPVVNELVELTKKNIAEASIYRATAFRIRMRDERGRPLPFPVPQFLDLNPNVESELVFPEDVALDVQINLFTPIEDTARVREAGIPIKRGILLAGPFGVGKTMAAHATALKCIRNGWTYLVCERSDELADVLRLAAMYRPAVVFSEDIDRVMSGERDVDIDHILNVIDGVESKNGEIMIVLTTNDIDNIHPALLRPGRLDAVINIDKPDAEAAERLARQYARGLIAESEDLTDAAKALAGRIPAVIREAVERSKLAAIALTKPGERLHITGPALLHSAKRMQFQLDMLEPKEQDKRSEVVKAAHVLAESQQAIAEKALESGQGVVMAGQPLITAVGPRDVLPKDDSGIPDFIDKD